MIQAHYIYCAAADQKAGGAQPLMRVMGAAGNTDEALPPAVRPGSWYSPKTQGLGTPDGNSPAHDVGSKVAAFEPLCHFPGMRLASYLTTLPSVSSSVK